ncbi:MAG: alpha-amylase family glycosyl hydrolase [Blautia sp.]|nr:alpha-amylase family glycosyl hydrolase [Blautia sp.]
MDKKTKVFKTHHGILSRFLSVILAVAMVLTLTPFGGVESVKAATSVKVRLYLELPDDWTTPVIHVWDDDATIENGSEGKASISQWGNQEKFKLKQDDTNTDLYWADVTSSNWKGFQFVDAGNKTADSAPEMQFSGEALITSYLKTLTSNTSLYCLKNGSGEYAWYKDANKSNQITSADIDLGYVSPEVKGNEVTFRYKDDSATQVRLAGTMTDWASNAVEMTKGADDIWTCTQTLTPNKWQYKFIIGDNDWKADPANSMSADGNSVVVVPGLVAGDALSATKGAAINLPETLTCYAEDGSSSAASVTYAVKDSADAANVTIANGKLTVQAGFTKTAFTLTATDSNGNTADITVNVVDKLYNYTIYYYDFNENHMSTAAADLWLWQKSGAGATEGTLFTGTETLDGNTWLKAEVQLPYTDLAIIARSKGGWSWQTGNVLYNNTAKSENVTIYFTSNSTQAVETIPDLIPPRDRYVLVEYDRPGNDYTGWNIYTWNSGFGSDVSVPIASLNGKMVAKIPVKDSPADLMLSFCMRRSETGNDWAEKDGGDHYVNVPANQTVVKAKFVQGKGITEVLPDNTGYTMDGTNKTIHFYYRDDVLAANNNLASLDGKVSITVNGTEHEMQYDATTDRFCFDLTDIVTGDYYYYYTVDDTEVLDSFNDVTEMHDGKECNKCTYRSYNMTISATMSQSTMDYNDNNVLTVTTNPAQGESMDGFAVASAIVDLSTLGLSSAQAINPALMELSIACKDTTAAGAKTLPVTVTDVYGNVYKTNVNVTVVARNKGNDFDWDEAVIYFAVTDRFFDGNESNNDAYSVGDYDTGAKGGSSYHGGDFAGLTAKLDYLQELGVNTIWITPIVENITEDQHDDDDDFATYGYHGYWASDFTKLNQHLGTETEFEALLNAAHSRNMKIMVDVVLNHAGYGTETYFNNIIDGDDGKIPMIRSAQDTVSGDDKLDALSGLPDFATENAAVRDQLVEWQTDWMDRFDIDYYRVDTVKHVDTTTWAAFKNSLTKVNPDFKMIGEYAGAGYANTAGELGTGTMDALLDFDFNGWAADFVTGNISGIEQNLQTRNGAIDNTAMMGSFLSSHDEDSLQATLVTEKGKSEQAAYNLAKVAAALQITAKGQPIIYYGEEIGQAGKNDWPYQTNRRDFDWAELETQKTDSNSMYNHYKTLLSIRNQYTDVFARGTRTTLDASDANGYDVFSRSYNGTTLYVGMNIKDTAASVRVATGVSGVYTDLYSGTQYNSDGSGNVSVTIPAAADGGTVILVRTGAITSSSSSSTSTTTSTETTPNKVVEVAEDGSVTETVTEEATNKAGNDVKVTTVTKKDAEGNVLSTTEKSAIENIAENTSATVTVKSDAEGNVTSAKAAVTVTVTNSTKTTITSDVVEQLTDAAGQSSVKITVTVKNTSGSTKYKYKVDTADLTPGNDLYIYKVDSKTGEYVMVNKKVYEVDEKGSVSVSASKKATYELVDAAQAEKINKKIVKTVKPKKTSVTVKNGKSKTFDFDSKLNMDNVKSVVYVSSKKTVVKVSSNGKITAKKPGTATVKAKVTLKNGTVKTVKIKVKVK